MTAGSPPEPFRGVNRSGSFQTSFDQAVIEAFKKEQSGVSVTYSGGGSLVADIIAQATSTQGDGATASANVVFQFTGVSSPSVAQNPNLQLTFDNGQVQKVDPYLGSPDTLQNTLKDNGPAEDTPGNKQNGDPIDVNTGNVYRSETDYSTAGPNPLSFTRYYNTFFDPPFYGSSLGLRWRSTFGVGSAGR